MHLKQYLDFIYLLQML